MCCTEKGMRMEKVWNMTTSMERTESCGGSSGTGEERVDLAGEGDKLWLEAAADVEEAGSACGDGVPGLLDDGADGGAAARGREGHASPVEDELDDAEERRVRERAVGRGARKDLPREHGVAVDVRCHRVRGALCCCVCCRGQ